MSFPTPATLAKLHPRKEQSSSPAEPDTGTSLSSPEVSETTESGPQKTHGVKPTAKKPFKRAEHLTQKPLRDNPGLQKLQDELKVMEGVNEEAGWYNRNKNGKQHSAASARQKKVAQAQALKDKGASNVAIAEKMGINESSVRSLLKPLKVSKSVAEVADILVAAVGESNLVDVGKGAEKALQTSAPKKIEAIKELEKQGYKRIYLQLKGADDVKTTIVVLAAPGTTFKNAYSRVSEIKQLTKENN